MQTSPFDPSHRRQGYSWRSPQSSLARPLYIWSRGLRWRALWLAAVVTLTALGLANSAHAALTAAFSPGTYVGGFQATLLIYNSTGSSDVVDWTGIITENNPLSSFYGATCTDTASPYDIAPTGANNYNATIHAGQSVQMGFAGTGVPAPLTLTINGSSVPVTTKSSGTGGNGAPATPSLSMQKNATSEFDATCSIFTSPYATSYKLLIDGATYQSGTMPAVNGTTQQIIIHIGDKPYSAHIYQFEAINSAGTTKSLSEPFASDNASPIEIAALNATGTSPDATEQARQVTVPLSSTTTTVLSMDDATTGTYTVASNNQTVATATVSGGKLSITALAPGRAGLRITNTKASPAVSRFLGIRVENSDGSLPGLPKYLSIGSVSQDTPEDMSFWQGFGNGQLNRRIDYRYIYLNGGPEALFPSDSWYGETDEGLAGNGARCYNYVRQCLTLGEIPFFVWYNIDGNGDGYDTDTGDAASESFMTAYYHDLLAMCTLAKTEAPDEPIGIVIEPDFLGYVVSNAKTPQEAATAATDTPAAVHVLYDNGTLVKGTDPTFADNVQGLVQSINYLFHKNLPNAYFGWEFALWGHPASGFTVASTTLGLMHLTDENEEGITKGRQDIYNEAAAETQWYLNAGVMSYGASFVSVDKYGLDAVGYESAAQDSPQTSTFFWSQTIWNNYLKFVSAMHDGAKAPVVLWQLPVGHINHSDLADPNGGSFPDLSDDVNAHYEDSAPTYFFGDTFDPTVNQDSTGATNRYAYFSGADNGADKDPEQHITPSTSSKKLVWANSWSMAADSGVNIALFGAGTGSSTTGEDTSNPGPATDADWSITAMQNYYINGPQPVTVTTGAPGTLGFGATKYSVNEDAGMVTVHVLRSGGSAGAASVVAATSSGTAKNGTDYTGKTQTLSWTDGDTSQKAFTIAIKDLGLSDKSTRTFSMKLSSPNGATLGTNTVATITIAENDPAGATLAFGTSKYSVDEDAGSITIHVLRTGDTTKAVTVVASTSDSTAKSGTDYTGVSDTLSWAAGDTAQQAVKITIANRGTSGGNGLQFSVKLASPTGGATLGSPDVATITIN